MHVNLHVARRCPQNVERDLHRYVVKAFPKPDVDLYFVDTFITRDNGLGNEPIRFPCLAPHELVAGIFEADEAAFRRRFVPDGHEGLNEPVPHSSMGIQSWQGDRDF